MATFREYKTINPATGVVVDNYPEATDAEVRSALDTAHTCFYKTWRHTPVAERARLINKVASLMRERTDELVSLIVLEVGKVSGEAHWEVQYCISVFEYFALHAEEFLKTRPVASSPGSEIRSEPLGVILAIEPWNFPLIQLARVSGPQLMAGNVLIAKPAPSVPQSSLAFAQLFKDAGVPEGVYTNIFATIPQINILIDDFRIRGITLTGSERAGAAVAEQAGRNLKRVVLELGGSDPFIVLQDASIVEAAKLALGGRMINAGQGCAASKRFIVIGKERADHFTKELATLMEDIKAGDPLDPATTMGPISSERGLNLLLEQLDTASTAGAKVILGGKRIQGPGFYLEPTILTHITPDNPIAQEETFGPIAVIYTVNSEEEAIELANNTRFGLGASVVGKDIIHAKDIGAQIEAGMVFINGTIYSTPDLPFGGVKNSGFGKELSELGFNEFVNKKLLRVAT